MDPTDLLPVEIPESLKRCARLLGGPDQGVVAWDRRSASAVLGRLDKSKVAVKRGEVFRSVPGGDLIPLHDWECHMLRGEQATAFAARSRAFAMTFVEKYGDDAMGMVLFAFDFHAQNAAA